MTIKEIQFNILYMRRAANICKSSEGYCNTCLIKESCPLEKYAYYEDAVAAIVDFINELTTEEEYNA